MQSFLAADGTRLAYRDEGQGLPVLALAGLSRNGADFDDLAACLPQLGRDLRFIRLDSRGRGGSAWADPTTYTIAHEARDVLALLDHLGLSQVAILGSSRGGLIGLLIAAVARERLLGLCLNDVGPVLEQAGLARIGAYLGQLPPPGAPGIAALKAARAGFANLPESRWQQEYERLFFMGQDGPVLAYDPALRIGFDQTMAQPLDEAWPLFDACAGLPLCLIRGQNSDLLSQATAREMCHRRPDMIFADVPDRGHIPFLDEPDALLALKAWLALIRD